MIKRLGYFLLVIVMCLTLGLFFGCTDTGKIDDGEINNPPTDEVFTPWTEFSYNTSYTPTTFDTKSVSHTITQLASGVRLIENAYTKTGDLSVKVCTVEVNLNKAEINAGMSLSGNSLQKAVPYQLMTKWESENENRCVVATVNADFFGSTCVNAFVADGKIIKDSHNDNNNYDYTASVSDVPASAPMLFGIKGNKAQIQPIIQYSGDITKASVKESVIKAKLYYASMFSGSEMQHKDAASNINPYNYSDSIVYIDTEGAYSIKKGSVIITLQKKSDSKLEVIKNENCISTKTLKLEEGCSYVVAHPDYAQIDELKKVKSGETYQKEVTSTDNTWRGYTTILGCRQALVIDGEIPNTVAKENTNGAQSGNVPRTAIGVKADGTVVIFSVEALTYGKYGNNTDTKGLNLPQLADFMMYYGIKDGANFDGGGSTQLITREVIESVSEPKVIVRSSDTGSTTLNESRSVINSILVTTKKK